MYFLFWFTHDPASPLQASDSFERLFHYHRKPKKEIHLTSYEGKEKRDVTERNYGGRVGADSCGECWDGNGV